MGFLIRIQSCRVTSLLLTLTLVFTLILSTRVALADYLTEDTKLFVEVKVNGEDDGEVREGTNVTVTCQIKDEYTEPEKQLEWEIKNMPDQVSNSNQI